MSHSDTSPEAAEILRERLRRMTPSQRVEEGAKLCKLARQFMRAGIRKRHPDYTEEWVEMALARARLATARPMTDERVGAARPTRHADAPHIGD